MADFVFNIAKGRIAAYWDRVDNNDPANSALILVLLKVTEADATLKDRDDLAAILANGNTEADFTNYARKTLTDSTLSASAPDDTNDRQDLTFPDQTWTAAGGATNNTLVRAIVCYDPDTTGGTDSALIPLVALDFAITTNGGDLTLDVGSSGVARAS